ncbi:hypothetical protein C3941_00525 [Kaistia algarum]|nr:hypothetical protein C3941_00525 [Kaistia algarum]
MDGDALLYVCRDEVVLCTTSISAQAVDFFLQKFLSLAKIRHDADQFILQPVSDQDALKTLQMQGVKEIHLGAVLYQASMSYIQRQHHPQGMLGALAKSVKAVLGSEHDVTPDALTVSVVLKKDGRMKGKSVGDARLQALGEKIVTDQQVGDDFAIITNDDQKITPQSIAVKTHTLIESLGKSVTREDAWLSLKAFFDKLVSNGTIEQ